ncbi:hypothetical protein BDY19DRAFT_945440 [Irpex rosettiformis]|uniref:Uncharacterized protein n=1 Tax=Irpex rosettiformis TaxID=378272 RepID=A0ACB8U4S7_9APHY|nr:hypothetical protein BDY19DRAFT_945440 [Irpex rosettiformis]
MHIDDGIYKISNAKARTSFLTMDMSLAQEGSHVFGYPWCGRDTQKWCVKRGRDSYTIQNVGTDRYLSINDRAADNRSVFGTRNSSSWTVQKVNGCAYRLYIQGTPFNLDLAGYGDATPGTRVSIWGANMGNLNQCWMLEKVVSQPKPERLEQASFTSGVYVLVNVLDGKVMDLSGDDHKSVITFPLHGGSNQQWHIESLGEGYSIRNLSSWKYLTVEEGICDGATVVANGFPVSWEISYVPEGRYRDIHIFWPTQRVAVSRVMSPKDNGLNMVQLQTFGYENEWQQWRLVEYPSVATASQRAAPQHVPVAPIVWDARALPHSVAREKESQKGSTTESASVTVSGDAHFIRTTRTAVTTATVSMPKWTNGVESSCTDTKL